MSPLPPTSPGLDKVPSKENNAPPISPILRPRARSPATSRRLQVKNRRRRYLELHLEYFDSPSHELADPLAYDRLIRRFQSAEEREKEGRKKGYAGLLEADLWRQEAKSAGHVAGVGGGDAEEQKKGDGKASEGDGLEEGGVPEDKEEGATRWRSKVEQRFMDGRDADFEYESVDSGDEFDDRTLQDRDEEERWFDEEEAAWTGERQEGGGEANGGGIANMRGQTGVQDF